MPRAFMITSSSGGSVPSIHAETSSTGRPRATANFSSSDSNPPSRSRRRSARPPSASVPRSSTGLSFPSSSFFASAIIGRPLCLVSLGRVVAEVLNLLDDGLLLHDVLVEVYDGGLAAEVHVGAPDARRIFESLPDERRARVAVHARYVKLGLHHSSSKVAAADANLEPSPGRGGLNCCLTFVAAYYSPRAAREATRGSSGEDVGAVADDDGRG